MISPFEATQKILLETRDFGLEKVPIAEAEGRVLAEKWQADRDFPPFDRASMDGIALRFEDFENGFLEFKIVGTQAAGLPAEAFAKEGDFSSHFLAEKAAQKPPKTAICLEIMTGAAVPDFFDSVVRFEDLEIAKGRAFLKIETVKKGQNVHRKGSDRLAGDGLAEPPRLISAAEIAVAATIGRAEILVKRKPLALVVSTGDELVEVAAAPLEHQIRRSNAHAVAAVLRKNGCRVELFHLADDPEAIHFFIENEAKKADFLIFSGGVSAGRFDFLPSVLAEKGCRKIFHGVRQRPGKPFWFGAFASPAEASTKAGAVVFGLPGNPVSTFMCLFRYVLPWLRASFGLAPFDENRAVLAEKFEFRPALDYFLQVKTHFSADGKRIARPVAGGGSGDLANLLEADAFLHLPAAERDVFEAGEAFDLFFYR